MSEPNHPAIHDLQYGLALVAEARPDRRPITVPLGTDGDGAPVQMRVTSTAIAIECGTPGDTETLHALQLGTPAAQELAMAVVDCVDQLIGMDNMGELLGASGRTGNDTGET